MTRKISPWPPAVKLRTLFHFSVIRFLGTLGDSGLAIFVVPLRDSGGWAFASLLACAGFNPVISSIDPRRRASVQHLLYAHPLDSRRAPNRQCTHGGCRSSWAFLPDCIPGKLMGSVRHATDGFRPYLRVEAKHASNGLRHRIRCGAARLTNSRGVMIFVLFQNDGKCFWLPVIR